MDKYLWILLVALLLASCSANDSEEQAGGSAVASAVSYDVTTDDAATRSVIANTQAFLTDGRQFRVWAFMKKDGTNTWSHMTSDYNDNELQAVDITYVAYRNEWTTTETYYWPRPEFAVDFYAIYPTEYEYNSNQILTFNTTNKTLDYTAPTNPDNAVDVMYATYHGQRNGEEKPDQRKEVKLKFYHALTQVSFYGKLSDLLVSLGWTVDINSITLCNVPSQGSLQLVTTTDPNVNQSASQFTNRSTPANYGFNMNPDRQTLTTATNAVLLTSPTAVAMLLPQKLTPWNKSSEITSSATNIGCYLKVGLTIKDGQGKYIIGTETTDHVVYAPFYCGIYADSDTNNNGDRGTENDLGWQSGNHYKYTLKFNGGYDATGHPVIQDIGFTAAIQPWITTEVTGTATHPVATP